MPYVLAVIVGLALLVAAGNAFTKLNPGQLALVLRRSAATVLLGTSGFLALRGFLPVAIPLFLLGLGLRHPSLRVSAADAGPEIAGLDPLLAMELDHDPATWMAASSPDGSRAASSGPWSFANCSIFARRPLA